jgi:FkbM family methyltransferase
MMPTGVIEATVRSGAARGLRLWIDPRCEKYYWTGTYEPAVQEAMAGLLGLGDVMWDVGAHAGFLTALASRLVGPAGEVVAFEPLPANIDRLGHLVRANRLDNVRIRAVAVSERTGRARFHVASSTSMGSLAPIVAVSDMEVSTSSLDAELDTLRPPRLVKIDVEGAEGAVLAGAGRLLSDVRPILIIELLSRDALKRAAEMLPSYTLTPLDQRNYLGRPCE